MRVTPTTMSFTVNQGLQGSLSRVQDLQEALSSGRRINRFSDDPADTVAALRVRGAARDWEAFSSAADDAAAWLATSDQALQSANTTLQRARELALRAANSALTSSEREAIATELEQLRDQLVGVANTTYLGKSVFAGFADTAVALSGGAWAYTGDAGQIQRRIGPDEVLPINVTAQAVFGFGSGADTFTLLDRMAADVRAGASSTVGGADLADLDARIADVYDALAVVGSNAKRVEAAQARYLDRSTTLESQRAGLEDADMLETIMNLRTAEAAYEAALGSAARLSLPSLASFLS